MYKDLESKENLTYEELFDLENGTLIYDTNKQKYYVLFTFKDSSGQYNVYLHKFNLKFSWENLNKYRSVSFEFSERNDISNYKLVVASKLKESNESRNSLEQRVQLLEYKVFTGSHGQELEYIIVYLNNPEDRNKVDKILRSKRFEYQWVDNEDSCEILVPNQEGVWDLGDPLYMDFYDKIENLMKRFNIDAEVEYGETR